MLRKVLLSGAASTFVVLASTGANAFVFYGDDMAEARDMRPGGTTFDSYLAREYRDFFLFEADEMYDWIDADYFAEKALAANKSGNGVIQPEDPEKWDIDEAHMGELIGARRDLMAAFDLGAREIAPEEAAIAQAKYDCWVEQQEEGHQPTHIAACRDQFAAALSALQGRMQAAMPQPEPQPEPATRMVIGEELAKTILYFDFDKANLTPDSAFKIDSFVEQMKGLQDVVVFVEGHADRAGPSDYNQDLSEQRAEMVRAALIREGIVIGDLEELKTAAQGESQPAVNTPDGVPEQANRRVEVVARGMFAEVVENPQ